MNDDKEKCDCDACSMEFTDADGNTNLCCCYAVDEDDNYFDPCDTPADECCC